MFSQNIILTGFMGTGKSTIGRLLAEQTSRIFVDTDELIEQKSGLAVPEIFARQGEDTFRNLEREIVLELAGRAELVVATGGGLVKDPLNVLRLAANGVIICLVAEPEDIARRLAGEVHDRPLIAGPEPETQIRNLLAQRDAIYSQFPQVHTGGKLPAQIATEVLQIVEQLAHQDPLAKRPTSRLSIQFPGGSYDIMVGRRLLPDLKALLPQFDSAVILTDENVGPLYASQLAGLNPMEIITIPAGERHKNLDTVRYLYDQLLAAGLDRQGTLVNLGGGVVGDIGGFVAATYLRGINLVQCPTSLLAMVDASIGGKSGVDLPQGKNLVGAFKQPEGIVVDLETLATLPAPELSGGMAEVIKHGLIANTSFLSTIADNYPSLQEDLGAAAWQELLVEAIQVKQKVVEQDPFESGRRAVLNLGHTFGHAIEQVSGYKVAHGPAVAIGLVAATHLSALLGHCSPQLISQVETVLTACDLPIRLPSGLSPKELIPAMEHDKKRAGGRLRFVLIRRPGDAFLSDDVPAGAIRQTWHALRS